MWRYNETSELIHYGIKGMKWGIRRYQNTDGSLTSVGKKRISKEYKKTARKVNKELRKTEGRRRLNSYNKAADYMNRGGIDEFNSRQKKKFGEKYSEREGYT